MKTFYILKSSRPAPLTIVHTSIYLSEIMERHAEYGDANPTASISIHRFVESYELNPKTNTWEVVTTERPVVLYPYVVPPPVNLTWF